MMQATGQTTKAYTSNGGVCVATKAGNQDDNKQIQIIHTIPKMTDTEQKAAENRINSDLYEVFSRIQSRLNLESEKNKS